MSENSDLQLGETSSKAVLADYLAKCQAAVGRCLQRADEYYDADQVAAATKLIRASIDLVAAIDGKPATTHRLVIERPDAVPGG